jgi:putative methionine-R-sulfoxide reductase with GAF domain
MPPRSATELLTTLRSRVRPSDALEARMRLVTEVYWHAYGLDTPGQNVSWCGFYLKTPGVDEMTLVCREPKPACSPIGLMGMCGRGWRDRLAYVVRDVRVLGEHYIACDPKDQSELVVPIFDDAGACVGVFDVDSYDVGAFTPEDAETAIAALETTGLLQRALLAGPTRVL